MLGHYLEVASDARNVVPGNVDEINCCRRCLCLTSRRSVGNIYSFRTDFLSELCTIIVDQQSSITVTLKDQNGNQLGNRTVSISINSASFANVTTGSNGQASFNWSPSNTGNYTVAASYPATGSSDTGYMPSSASIVVSVIPQKIVNTQTTGSGTQSVTFQTAQGNPQSSASSLSVSVGFPSIGSISVAIQWGSLNISGSVGESNQFGLACVAKVFGTCVMVVPYWKAHINLNIPNYGWLSLVDNLLSLDQPSVTYSIPCLSAIDTGSPAFRQGVTSAALMELPLIGILFASVFEPGAAEGAALIWDAAMIWGMPLLLGVVPQMYATTADRFNYAAGVLLTFLTTSGEAVATVLGIAIQRGVLATTPDVKILVLLGAIYGLLMSALFTIAYCNR
jgi:hypothetical protein